MILQVPYMNQSIKYPTGCESVSAVMLLHYLGYELDADTFIEKYLEQDTFELRNGELFGPDPRKVFCGSPYDKDSFGCYAPVIVKALNQVFKQEPAPERIKNGKYHAIDATGKTAKQLTEEYVEKGIPVIFWACIDMKHPIAGPDWKLKETGENFMWISNEHCLLLVGEDEDGFYFNDPYENHGMIRYEKKLTEDRHKAQLLQAVAVICDEG